VSSFNNPANRPITYFTKQQRGGKSKRREREGERGREREKWHGMKTIHFPNGGEKKRDFTTTYLNNNNGLQQGTQVTKSIDF
jgi:hypothetical protein